MKVEILPALLPCPFCGSPLGGSIGTYLFYYEYSDEYQHFIECPACEARGSAEDDEQEAIDAWNRRPVIRKRTAGGSKQVFECAGCDGIGLYAHLSTGDSWLRVDLNRGLGLCSSCEHLVSAWDQLGLPHQTF
jgi:Lar family restriction alleviation protein